MRTIRRLAVGTLAGLTLALSGCADEAVPGPDDPAPAPATTAPAPAPTAPTSTPSAPPTPTGAAAAPGGDSDGDVSGVYGPGCDQVPAQGEGSIPGMVDDPVLTAAANNPLLRDLATAVYAAGLGDTLNDPEASYTVFAPADAAFDALTPSALQQLFTDPQGALTGVLTYHVVPGRYDAEGLARAGSVPTVHGAPLTISGQPGSLVIDEQQRATVLCGNIQTANATVFVIDRVLMPPA